MPVIYVEKLDSTNAYAKSNIEILSDRDVVIADAQTAGRGRLARSWDFLGADNVYMSFVLKPSEVFLDIYSNITQYLSVVLCKVLDSYRIDSQIKWPNDVLVNDKKIAGILSETLMCGTEFKGLVLGIGVNLNCSAELIAKIDKPATSLNLETNKPINKIEFIKQLSDEFFLNYDEFLRVGFEFIKEDYLSHASFLDKEICVNIFNEVKHGYVKGVTSAGALILNVNNNDEIITIGDIL